MCTMKRSIKVFGVLAISLLTLAVAAVAGEVKTHLSGYEETPLTISSTGSGEFKAKINHDGTALDYELTYRDLESTVTQAHIHFGRPAISGGIVLFLCTNLGNAPATVPTPQACPAAPATITGTLTAADVIAVAGQGINSGDTGFAEILEAIRASATYVNVHTTGRPSGEIRGRLRDHGHDAH
jgi:CHRD domain-containing protein